MADTTHREPRRRFRRALTGMLAVLAVLLLGGIAFTWAWNTLAVDLAQAPRVQFRHALAFELAVVALAWLVGASFRLAAGQAPAHRRNG